MPDSLSEIVAHPWVYPSAVVAMLVIGALFGKLIVRRLLLKGINHLLRNTPFGKDSELRRHKVIPRLANIVPAAFVLVGIRVADGVSGNLFSVIQNATIAFIILTLAMAASGAIKVVDTIYHRSPENRTRPVKGYMQILRIAVYIIATILVFSVLLDRSPVILLSGLGAMAAVLILIFQDTILSFVASIQISLNDMVRVGDWVEMPEFNADGEVVEIALHTVKIMNWDNTISTIPIRNFVTHSYRNWRGMIESGGRRIKRSIQIDQGTIRFLTEDETARLSQLRVLSDYLDQKGGEISDWNARLDPNMPHPVNTRRLTNIGTFRAYIDGYIRQHPDIRGDMITMVRQLAPSSKGVPIELYCFTNTTAWVRYESIQSDIFDHLLSIAGEFGLSVFQEPSGQDIAALHPSSGEGKRLAA